MSFVARDSVHCTQSFFFLRGILQCHVYIAHLGGSTIRGATENKSVHIRSIYYAVEPGYNGQWTDPSCNGLRLFEAFSADWFISEIQFIQMTVNSDSTGFTMLR